MTRVEFFVPGTPRPQGSKAHVGNGRLIEMADRKTKTRPAGALKDWRYLVSMCARQAMRNAGLDMHDGPVVLALTTVKARPTSYPKTLFRPDVSPPDWDKLARAISDACSGVVFRDDAQIVHGRLSKLVQWDGGATAAERGPVGCYVNVEFHTSESLAALIGELSPLVAILTGQAVER